MNKKSLSIWYGIPIILCLLLQPVLGVAQTSITSNTSWTSSNTYYGDVIVSGNATLTISGNITIQIVGSLIISPGSKVDITNATMKIRDRIDVRSDYTNASTTTNGAWLIANSATFTPYNNTNWDGIEVWGMNRSNKRRTPQGYAAKATLNNSTIEKSYYGVSNFKDAHLSIYYEDASGGVIQAYNTLFKNNTRGLQMINQEALNIGGVKLNDKSYFLKCQFICDAQPPSVIGTRFVHLEKVEGVTFKGCEFGDQSTGHYMIHGIFSNDAGFIVEDYCTTAPPNSGKYNGMCSGANTRSQFYGFIANSSGQGGSAAIQAINTIGSVHNIVVEHGLFTDINCMAIGVGGAAYGSICGNDIGVWGPDITDVLGFIGIAVSSTPGIKMQENSVTANSYSGWTPNASHTPVIGVITRDVGANANMVYNNSFSNMDYAMECIGNNRTDPASGNFAGMQYLCNDITSSISESYDIISAVNGYPYAGTSTPNTGLAVYQRNIWNTSSQSAGNLFSYKTGLSTYNNLFNTLQGTGNYQIKDYYSTASALEAPTYTNLPNSDLLSVASYGCPSRILAWNPMSLNAFKLKLPVNPNGSESNEENGRILVRQQQLFDSVMTTFMLNDSLGIQLDSIELALNEMDYLYDYKILLANIYVAQDRFDDAMNLLSAIDSDDLNTDEATRIANIIDVIALAKDLDSNNYNWSAVNSTLKSRMATIADEDDYYAREWARYYMTKYEDIHYGIDYVWVDGSGSKQAVASIRKSSIGINSVYPNPVNDKLYIDVADNSNGNITAILTDITGRVIFNSKLNPGNNTLDVNNLVKGTYFVKITDSKGRTKTTKLVKN